MKFSITTLTVDWLWQAPAVSDGFVAARRAKSYPGRQAVMRVVMEPMQDASAAPLMMSSGYGSWVTEDWLATSCPLNADGFPTIDSIACYAYSDFNDNQTSSTALDLTTTKVARPFSAVRFEQYTVHRSAAGLGGRRGEADAPRHRHLQRTQVRPFSGTTVYPHMSNSLKTNNAK